MSFMGMDFKIGSNQILGIDLLNRQVKLKRSDNVYLFVWATVVGIGISYVMVHGTKCRWIKVA